MRLPIVYWTMDGLKEISRKTGVLLIKPVPSISEYCFDRGRYHDVKMEPLQKDSKILIGDVILIIKKNDQGWLVIF